MSDRPVLANPRVYVLWSTLGCHLCEHADEVLQQVKQQVPALSWRSADIADDVRLVERYGVRIPVLYCPESEQELGWPFTVIEVKQWLTRVDALHCSEEK